jgi:UDP-N-acetylglucosamine 1-carboxyvinyltransferase
LRIHAKTIKKHRLIPGLTRQLRASVLLMGPLVARLGRMEMIHPGGCVIGKRPVGTHFDALEALGVKIIQDKTNYYLKSSKLKANSIYLDEQSVTATENSIMAASVARGETIIKNAASERHVVALADYLNGMGAKISGAGTSTIKIVGVKKLKGNKTKVIDDEIEIGTFIALALSTKSTLSLKVASFDGLEPILHKSKQFGAKINVNRNRLTVIPPRKLSAVTIKSYPWPGFPTDLEAPFSVVATQAEGTSLVHDWMYERRLFYIDELTKMGANIVMCDPHRALITGPTKLLGTHIISPDIRAGIALVIAGLTASGKTTIENIELIERGYYKIEERLAAIGAKIERIEE